MAPETREAPAAPPAQAHGAEGEMTLPHGSRWPILAAMGIALIYFGVLGVARWGTWAILGAGVVVVLAAAGGLVREDERWWRGHVGTGLRNGWWGVLFFLGTEVMLFAALFATYFNHRAAAAAWPPTGIELPVVRTGINTVVLLASGVTAHWAHTAIRRGNQRNLKIGLVLTILLGAAFLAGQALEYTELAASGLTVQSGTFGATFYMLTGTHGAHVLGGLGILGVCAVRAFRGQFDQKRHVAVEVSAIYWHFVDVVWVLLYAIVYLQAL